MALLASQVYDHIRHALSGDPAAEIPVRQIANDAGDWLVSTHPWKWLERTVTRLDLRGSISVTAGTWAESTRTLTATAPASAFANYVPLFGDDIEITAGTGATLDFYKIESRPSATSIVTATSIGSAADTQTNIAGTIELPGVALPSDFQSLLSIKASNSLVDSIEEVSFTALLELRTSGVELESSQYVYSITSASDPTGSGAPVNRLDIYPVPSANSNNFFSLFYRAGWVRLSNDSAKVQIPEWMEGLYKYAAREFALGLEEADTRTLESRLDELRGGTFFASMARRDGLVQPSLGLMSGGAVAREMYAGSRFKRYLRTTVANPD